MTSTVRIVNLGIAHALLFVCGAGLWQTSAHGDSAPPTSTAPVFRIGDCWVYEIRDPLSLDDATRRSHEWVRRVRSDGGVEISARPRDEAITALLDGAGDYVLRHGIRWEPSQGLLHFPMTVGTTWKSSTVTRRPGASRPSLRESEFKVKGFGKVHAQAGDFDAFEVQEIGTGYFEGSPFHFSIHSTIWYAPSVGRIVLIEREEHDLRDFRRLRQEMIRYGHHEGLLSGSGEASAPSDSSSGGEKAPAVEC